MKDIKGFLTLKLKTLKKWIHVRVHKCKFTKDNSICAIL